MMTLCEVLKLKLPSVLYYTEHLKEIELKNNMVMNWIIICARPVYVFSAFSWSMITSVFTVVFHLWIIQAHVMVIQNDETTASKK